MSAIRLSERLFQWVHVFFCRHKFKYKDMKDSRDANDDRQVKWPCTKCGHEFNASCGLSILDHGSVIEDEDQP